MIEVYWRILEAAEHAECFVMMAILIADQIIEDMQVDEVENSAAMSVGQF